MRMTADSSLGAMQQRREWSGIFEVLKEKSAILEFYVWLTYASM